MELCPGDHPTRLRDPIVCVHLDGTIGNTHPKTNMIVIVIWSGWIHTRSLKVVLNRFIYVKVLGPNDIICFSN